MSGKVLVGATLAWLTVAGGGLIGLWAYAQQPGPSAVADEVWPAHSGLLTTAGTPTLVLFLHPQCPCSRATIGELALLMARVPRRVTVHAVFYRPPGSDVAWAHTDLWESARSIPGVAVTDDEDAAEARMFGARISGQVLFYDGERRVVFNGGITAARGHAGDNAGRSALQALLTGSAATVTRTPVFGCYLFGDA